MLLHDREKARKIINVGAFQIRIGRQDRLPALPARQQANQSANRESQVADARLPYRCIAPFTVLNPAGTSNIEASTPEFE